MKFLTWFSYVYLLINFTQSSFYTQKRLHTEELYTQKLLCKETFGDRNFYTQKCFHKKPLHRGTFTQRSFYAQTRLHTAAFTHRSFCKRSLPIFSHVSCFMIIHHLSSSYLRFHALLVNSLHHLVFIWHGVLSIHASSLLPLRRSKLNGNPE